MGCPRFANLAKQGSLPTLYVVRTYIYIGTVQRQELDANDLGMEDIKSFL
jgi:hypothetical protein